MSFTNWIKSWFNKADDDENDADFPPERPNAIRTPGRNKIVYRGESEQALIAKLKRRGKVDPNMTDEDVERDGNLGTIFIGTEKKHSWIAKKKTFMGWKVFITHVPTHVIRFK